MSAAIIGTGEGVRSGHLSVCIIASVGRPTQSGSSLLIWSKFQLRMLNLPSSESFSHLVPASFISAKRLSTCPPPLRRISLSFSIHHHSTIFFSVPPFVSLFFPSFIWRSLFFHNKFYCYDYFSLLGCSDCPTNWLTGRQRCLTYFHPWLGYSSR